MSCLWCLGGLAKSKEEKPLIVDVEKVVADAAWDMFIHTNGRCRRRFLRRKDFKIEVPMNYYHFEQDGETKFTTKKRPSGAVDSGCDIKPSQSLLKGKPLTHRDQTSPEHLGLETVFNNDTDREQTYNFRFDKTRRASLNVSYQKGYSFGGKANFNLGLPKVLGDESLGLEMNMNIQVTKTTGETFEESLTTSSNSEIKVAANSHYTVSVVMEEKRLLADFQMKMIMSMPAKLAPVYIKNKGGEEVFVHYLNNLSGLFEAFPNISRVKDENGKVRPDAVEFNIEGIVDGMQLSSHYINLSGHVLQSKPNKAETDQCRDGGESIPEAR